ncbi:MAG: DUF4352 domain-containing protein, partial [Chloroflexota bacterium]|nr:DUF4352 domain-containing protein [Chloroflexota bacterium]
TLARQATSTARAEAANATATAKQVAYESYKKTPPQHDFFGSGVKSGVGLGCRVTDYTDTIGSWTAGKGSKWIIIGCRVENRGSGSLSVNPFYFTLVSTDGYAYNVDSHTYLLNNSMKSIDVPTGSFVQGFMAFYTSDDTVPGRLVWDNFRDTINMTIVEAP